jgi:hypothetical protein
MNIFGGTNFENEGAQHTQALPYCAYDIVHQKQRVLFKIAINKFYNSINTVADAGRGFGGSSINLGLPLPNWPVNDFVNDIQLD